MERRVCLRRTILLSSRGPWSQPLLDGRDVFRQLNQDDNFLLVHWMGYFLLYLVLLIEHWVVYHLPLKYHKSPKCLMYKAPINSHPYTGKRLVPRRKRTRRTNFPMWIKRCQSGFVGLVSHYSIWSSAVYSIQSTKYRVLSEELRWKKTISWQN